MHTLDTLSVFDVWLSATSSSYLNVPAGDHARTVGEQIRAGRRALAVRGVSSARGVPTRPGPRCRRVAVALGWSGPNTGCVPDWLCRSVSDRSGLY